MKEWLFSLIFVGLLGAFIWGGWKISKLVARSMARIWVMAVASLAFCILFPVGVDLSNLILARDDGSEAIWSTSEKVLDFALLTPLFACLLGFVGLIAALQENNHKSLSSRLTSVIFCLATLCLGGLEILYTLGGGEPGRHIAFDEAAAVGSLRSLYVANLAYAAAHPSHDFAPSIADLRKQSQSKDESISAALARGKTHGYRFTYTLTSTKAVGNLDGFQVVAEPLILYESGVRYFFIDQTGVVRFDTKYPTDKSPPL